MAMAHFASRWLGINPCQIQWPSIFPIVHAAMRRIKPSSCDSEKKTHLFSDNGRLGVTTIGRVL